MKNKPQYFNALETKKFDSRAAADAWLKQRKREYKDSGQPVKTTVDYGNDQRWQAKILPKVS
jgi:hypothetical protein